ncbi:hypothetical protein, partial [Flavivirga jejuensis]
NAHVIIEEYDSSTRVSNIEVTTDSPGIFVLSAKTERALKEQALLLLEFISEESINKNTLADIAYTLQIGRESFEYRLAMLAVDLEALKMKLQSFIGNEKDIDDLYQGQVKRNKESLNSLSKDEDMHKTIEAWIQKKKYTKLLELWVKGFSFDWNNLYNTDKPLRISLPTYPFSKDRYWI